MARVKHAAPTTQLFLFAITWLAALVAAQEPIFTRYHENVGIRQAELIRQSELVGPFGGRRVGWGALAPANMYPYLGGLLISLTSGNTSVCSTSLLSNTRAITAAHCWWDGRQQALSFLVVLGSNYLYSGGTRITTNIVQTHELYNPYKNDNDIAIISMNYVAFSNTIKGIAIATDARDYAGEWALAAGFGWTSDPGKITANQQVSHLFLKVITNSECQKSYGTTIDPSKLCTSGAGGGGPCHGDSGGPLVKGNTLIGITSFVAKAGCQVGMPAAYTRVGFYANWLRARLY